MGTERDRLNVIEPPAFRLAAVWRRRNKALHDKDFDLVDTMAGEIEAGLNELSQAVERLGSFIDEESLQTTIGGVLSQLRRKEAHR